MCKKAWCTCKVVVLLINLLLCLLFSLPSPSPSSLLKLSIVVIQKFCYHGNVTSHWPLSIGPVLLPETTDLGIEIVSCRLLQRVARWAWIGPTFSSLTTMCTKIPQKNHIWWNLRFDHIYFITLQELKQNWMQGWHDGKRLIYRRPIFRLTKN